MRFAVTIAVLLAVVATALVAVCQHSETRRLEREVWRLERRKDRLEGARRRLAAAVAASRTPRRLLEASDGSPLGTGALGCDGAVCRDAYDARTSPVPADVDGLLPSGFVLGDHFEDGGR